MSVSPSGTHRNSTATHSSRSRVPPAACDHLQVMDAELEAQQAVAPFLSIPVLRRLVQTFANDPRGDFSKWATNPLVIDMLRQAKQLIQEGCAQSVCVGGGEGGSLSAWVEGWRHIGTKHSTAVQSGRLSSREPAQQTGSWHGFSDRLTVPYPRGCLQAHERGGDGDGAPPTAQGPEQSGARRL